jgi:F-type H+-transporting ATPase subunit b
MYKSELIGETGMNTGIDLVASLDAWSMAEEGLSFNTNLLDTNLINLAVVIGVLVYFGKGVCAG